VLHFTLEETNMYKLLFLAGLSCLFSGLSFASSFTNVVVAGSANIQTANGNADPATCCNGASLPAVLALTFAAGPNQVLTFNNISGMVGCAGSLTNGADGGCLPFTTNISPLNSISGLMTGINANMFLVGVFTGDATPSGPPPALLDYTNAAAFSLADYTPYMALDRVFFIGDGLTGTGTGATQRFGVPVGATRLYLGFIDAFNFQGAPGFYTDNVGTLTVNGSVDTVPEPGTLALLPLGAAALWLLKRRR